MRYRFKAFQFSEELDNLFVIENEHGQLYIEPVEDEVLEKIGTHTFREFDEFIKDREYPEPSNDAYSFREDVLYNALRDFFEYIKESE